LAAGALGWREIVRFFRQRNRVVGAVGQPMLFWLLFSVGLNRSFQVPGQDFGEYFIPGTLVLILLFTAIFSTISVIEDRQEGFLQSVLVAPIPRWAMVLGKVLGCSLIALAQSLIFLALALMLRVEIGIGRGIAVIALLGVASVALTSLGLVIAWRLDSTQGFHAIMNLLLMPMWLLSGAFFPIPSLGAGSTVAEVVIHWVMCLNPVSYVVAGLRQLMFGDVLAEAQGSSVFWRPTLLVCWTVSCLFAAAMFLAACGTAGRRKKNQ
jgi:ABC-2 type transport system permease protein